MQCKYCGAPVYNFSVYDEPITISYPHPTLYAKYLDFKLTLEETRKLAKCSYYGQIHDSVKEY